MQMIKVRIYILNFMKLVVKQMKMTITLVDLVNELYIFEISTFILKLE